MNLWQAGNAISIVDLYKALGLPDAEGMAQRYLESNTNPQGFLEDIKLDEANTDAETDIQLLIANKTPEERDDYDQSYFNYFNKFIASNRYSKLADKNTKAALRIQSFLAAVQHVMMESLNLQQSMQPPQGVPQPGMPPVGPEGQPPVPGEPTAAPASQPPTQPLPQQAPAIQ